MKKITINNDLCIGCGSCVALAQKTFAMTDDGKVKVINPSGDPDETIQQAIDSCPVGAISVVKD